MRNSKWPYRAGGKTLGTIERIDMSNESNLIGLALFGRYNYIARSPDGTKVIECNDQQMAQRALQKHAGAA